jgi:hypothetical protein
MIESRKAAKEFQERAQNENRDRDFDEESN